MGGRLKFEIQNFVSCCFLMFKFENEKMESTKTNRNALLQRRIEGPHPYTDSRSVNKLLHEDTMREVLILVRKA